MTFEPPALAAIVAAALTVLANSVNGAPSIPRYEAFEAQLASTKTYSNPFTNILTAAFTSPSGRLLTAYGFYDGGNTTWRVRIAPEEIGVWSYRTTCSDPGNAGLHDQTGSFECVPSASKGFIRPDPARKYWFAFSDGTPFFGVGDTCYGMVNGINNTQRLAYLDARASQQFNFIRFFASGFPMVTNLPIPAAEAWPWGGSRTSPDYDRLNPQYFQRLEAILGELKARDMRAEVEVFNYYSQPFTSTSTWTTNRQNLWARYVISRLSPYTAVFLWTVANEYETYPEGTYRYDNPSDDAWGRNMGDLFHSFDPHKHPTTVHNFSFDSNGGIGGRFGPGSSMDALTQQRWGSATWTTNSSGGQYLDGNASGIETTVWTDRIYDKPVINTENGYEWLAGFPTTYNQQSAGTDKSRRVAWRLFTAGGAAYAAGFAGTWHGNYNFYWGGQGPLFFQIADMGLAAQVSHYARFITTKTDFRNMNPAQNLVNASNLCLANIGKEYVIYAPTGGLINLDLSGTLGSYSVEWLDPRLGTYYPDPPVSGGAERSFTAPNTNDWVLHLLRQDSGLRGRWTFDEGSGLITADQSGNGNHAALVNAVGWSNSPYGSYCLDFNPSLSNRLCVGDPVSLQLTGAMTLSAWVKRRTIANDGRIISKLSGYNPVTSGYSLGAQSASGQGNGLWSFQIASGSSIISVAVANPAAAYSNQWVHLAGVYDPSIPAMRIYTNGVLGNTLVDGVPPAQTDSGLPVYLGGNSSANPDSPAHGNFWDGQLDDVRIYSRALGGSELGTLAGLAAVSLHPGYPCDATSAPCLSGQSFEVKLLSGSPPVQRQWFDAVSNSAIPAETNAILTVPVPLTSGSFYCVVSNDLSCATSRVAVLTITNDTVLPSIGSVGSIATNQLRVVFNKAVSAATAQNPNNYTLDRDGGERSAVSTAILQADGKTVTLTLATPLVASEDYTLAVVNVQDLACPPNTIATNTLATFHYNLGLVGYWTFEEGSSSTTADQSGYGATGACLNSPRWTNSPFGSTCLEFDATNSKARVSLGNPTQLQITGPMTLSAWVFYLARTNTPDTLGRIISKQSSGAAGWELNVEEWTPEGWWSFAVASNATTRVPLYVEGSRYQTNRWVHFAGVYDPIARSMRLYTNGILGGSIDGETVPAGLYNSTNSVYIGGGPGTAPTGGYWRGKIDEVRVYNRALSASEVAALAAIPPVQFKTISLESNTLRLSWTRGRLEWAPVPVGPWASVFPVPPSPYVEAVVPGTNRFFRLNAMSVP